MHLNNTVSRALAIGAAAVAIVAVSAGAGYTAATVGTSDIQNGAVTSAKIRNGNVYAPDTSAGLQARIDSGKVTRLESDGPYPGATDLGDFEGQGDNSDELVPADGQEHVVWVECAPGKLAVGPGGFTKAADAGLAAAKAVDVLEAAPAQVENGELVYSPILGDDAGSFRANAYAVKAVNDGTSAVVVRPWVTCAKVAE